MDSAQCADIWVSDRRQASSSFVLYQLGNRPLPEGQPESTDSWAPSRMFLNSKDQLQCGAAAQFRGGGRYGDVLLCRIRRVVYDT